MEIIEFCNNHPEISSLDRITIERMHAGKKKTEQQWYDLLKKDFVSVAKIELKVSKPTKK